MRNKKLNSILLLIIMVMIWQNAYSQNMQNEYEEWKPSQDEYTNFDISKYFTPDIVRNQLDINFDLNSNYSHSNLNSNSEIDVYSTRSIYSKSSTYNIDGSITSNFLRYVNTRRKITNFSVSLSLNGQFASQKQESDLTFSDVSLASLNDNRIIEDVNSVSTNSLGLIWSNQWYFSKPFFMIYSIRGNLSYNFTQNKEKNQSTKLDALSESNQKQNQFVFDFSPKVGIGYGRIENVEDARQAIYIANALSKKRILTRNLSTEELFDLSQQISTVKNKRFLDSRLHLIDEITTIDSFFVKNDLLSNNGAAYFTTLYDMWQYGALFSRKSGYEISFVAFPYYTYNYLKNTPKVQDETTHYPQHRTFLETDLTFNYEKPVKLNWQHSVVVVSAAVFPEKEKESNSLYSNLKLLETSAQYSLGYYPNTRTNIQGTVGQQIRKIMYENDYNYTNYITRLSVNINYYISPYFRITGSYGINYQHYLNKYNDPEYYKNNNFSTSFNIHLIYSIF